MRKRLSHHQIVATASVWQPGTTPAIKPDASPALVVCWRTLAAISGWQLVLWPDGTLAIVRTLSHKDLVNGYTASRKTIATGAHDADPQG